MKLTELFERIYADPPKAIITTQADKYSPSPDEISTYLKPLGVPYKAEGKMTNGVPVYSVYLYQSAGADGTTTQLLKALKGSGPLSVDDAQLTSFINRTADWLKRFFAVHDVEVVVYPKSSSPFLKDFVAALEKRYKRIQFQHESFIKREVKDLDAEIDSFLDKEHPEYEKLGAKNQEDLKKSIKRELQKSEAAGKGLTLTAKGIFKNHAKFVQNFMKFIGDSKSLDGKTVCIIDDVLSSGSTFNDMAKQLKGKAGTVLGLTVFKRTNAPPK